MKQWMLKVYWKNQLKKRYLQFRAIADQFDCGHAIASHVSRRYCDAVDSVNEAIRKVNEFDPTAKLSEIEVA